MFTLPTLYSIAKKGNIQKWTISAYEENGGAFLSVEHGQVDGKLQKTRKQIYGKNIGKKNETSDIEQAISEAKSQWKKRIDTGDTEEIPKEDDAPVIFLPMLAHKYKDHHNKMPFPCFVQPKLNGIRCLSRKVSNTEIEYISRKNKRFTTLDHLTPQLLEIMEVGEIFDGEIYVHGWTFQEITKAIKKQRGSSLLLEYHIYDIANSFLGFKDRTIILQNRILLLNRNLIPVYAGICESPLEIVDWQHMFVKDGYEGLMVRNPDSYYEYNYRSYGLLKYKDFVDEEFEIIGGKEGSGNDLGCIIFKCRAKNGLPFDVRPKGSVAYRKQLFNDLPSLIGKELTVRYQNLSDEGKPIFPVGLSVRDYE